MVLELAENGRGKFVYINKYKRRPSVSAHKRRKPKGLSENYNPYIYVPAHLNDGLQGVFLREDHFDHLSEGDWDTLMDELLDHQPEIAELAGKGKARREAKKEKKAEKKAAKEQRKAQKKDDKSKRKSDRNERKNTKAQAKAKAKETKAEAKRLKGQAKIDKANSGGGRNAGDIFDTIVDKASSTYNKFKGVPDAEYTEDTDNSGSGGSGGSGGGSSSDDTILGMPKMVALGVGAALLLGIGYVATRPRNAA